MIDVQRGFAAGHLQRDVEALRHAELVLHVVEVAARGSTASVAPMRPRDLEPVRVEVGDDDVAGAGVPHDRGRHAADRARAGDEHVLTQHREGERGVHRVSERVEDRRHVLVDTRPVVPDVRHRQRHELRERPGPVDAEPDRVRAQMAPARHAVAAASADDVTLARDDVARMEVAHVRARPRRSRRRTRARPPSAPGSSAAPTRPSGGCAGRCRRSPSCGRGSERR